MAETMIRRLTARDTRLSSFRFYDLLAMETGTPASTLRSHVTRLRTRYRELIRARVRQMAQTRAEVDGELHDLFRVLVGG